MIAGLRTSMRGMCKTWIAGSLQDKCLVPLQIKNPLPEGGGWKMKVAMNASYLYDKGDVYISV